METLFARFAGSVSLGRPHEDLAQALVCSHECITARKAGWIKTLHHYAGAAGNLCKSVD
jgi:hypothetical protein